jgi:hypothetical protein
MEDGIALLAVTLKLMNLRVRLSREKLRRRPALK